MSNKKDQVPTAAQAMHLLNARRARPDGVWIPAPHFRECLQYGWIYESSPGVFRITDAGIAALARYESKGKTA